MKSKKVIIAAVIFIMVCFIAVFCYSLHENQTVIDGRFEAHYGELVRNMHMAELNTDEYSIAKYDTENTIHGAFITELFPYTSYSGNGELYDIVINLDRGTGYDAVQKIAMSDELEEKLFMTQENFKSEEAAREAMKILADAISY